MNHLRRRDRDSPQDDARHHAKRLDALAGVVNHLFQELDDVLIACGAHRDVCGPLGKTALLEIFVRELEVMACGESRDTGPSFVTEVERALSMPRNRVTSEGVPQR